MGLRAGVTQSGVPGRRSLLPPSRTQVSCVGKQAIVSGPGGGDGEGMGSKTPEGGSGGHLDWRGFYCLLFLQPAGVE